MKKLSILCMLCAMVLLIGSMANASPFTITEVDGDWQNPVGGTNVSVNNASDPSTIRWGIGVNQSGYDFDARNTPFNVVADSTPFLVGEFSHFNFPI